MKVMRYLAWMLAFLTVTSCLFDNDLSYPKISADILSFQVEGQTSVRIDNERREIHVELSESADLMRVKVLEITLSEGAALADGVPQYLDLTTPVNLTVKTYGETVWTIYATQPVIRYINVENQVGEAEFDVKNRSAVVYVSSSQSLSAVTILDMKLEREGSEVVSTTATITVDKQTVEQTLECVFPMTLECVMLRKFTVLSEGETVEWIVRVLNKEVAVEVTSVNAWARHAYVTALFDGKGNPYFEYRRSGEDVWTKVMDVSVAGTGVSADFGDLSPETSYEVILVNGEMKSSPVSFVTEAASQVPNMNFDDWYTPDPSSAKAIWYPYAAGGIQAWDSANPGAAAFIGSSTVPEESFVVKGKAAKLESKYAVIAFAAGNIYTGKFGKIAGVGAELDWGYEFSSRPSALKGYYSYAPKPIDKADKAKEELIGQMDKCQIQVILADWDAPFRINTTKGRFVDIEKDEHIIAFGRIETDQATGGEYKEFTIDLEYRTKTRKPKYVVISACASYLGDYFTGGVGSTLYVDEFEFVY